ncbi:hypothetical protein SISNIDRAFT_547437 [Sistotremastrum niveocremeum HHB9708]|uniref:F-box domain-containing protein n=1 Tax=Sistotremastrum niveocremeum HHB9708 TaxID=1314777 RepID=A0A164Y7H9_9AGAM|nr:hypothetical protein SISNIDRAFT_547437 [Sistotremastrum niveocremeum HHB9708]
MRESDVDDSTLDQGAASQAHEFYTSQIPNNTQLPLTKEGDPECYPLVGNLMPMTLSTRTNIASLPTEILLEIFKFYVSKGMMKDLQWWCILRVCSRWRQVILDTPYLWQEIRTHWHPEIVKLFEMRSRSHPLTIQRSAFPGVSFGGPSHDFEGTTTARLVAAHMSRIQDLQLGWVADDVDNRENMYEVMRRCVEDANFPNLTRVFLGSHSHYLVTRSIKLNAPSLKVLKLYGLVPDSTSYPNFANVTVLRLQTLDLAVEDIIALVEACPQLEYCDIQTYVSASRHVLPELQPLPSSRVPLRALKDLNISHLHWMSLLRLLDCLEIYPTANIRLQIPPVGLRADNIEDVLLRIVTPLILSYDGLEISSHETTLKRSTERGFLNFNIPDEKDASYLAFSRFPRSLSYFSLPTIGVHLSSISIAKISGHWIPEIGDIWSAFSGFPNLEVLSLRECDDINNFLLAFTYDATAVICPRLRRLDLHDSYCERLILLDFVKERHTKDSLASIEWARVVAGLFPEEELSELRACVEILVEEPRKESRG